MTTARQDALIAQIRTAHTKAERRSAVRSALAPDETARADLNAQVRSFLLAQVNESRAAGEGTNSAGGYLTPPGFSGEVVRLLKEYDAIISDCEDLPTPHGQSWKRPQVSSLVASGAALSENSAESDGTSTLISFPGQQSFGITPTYPALLTASLQLLQDSFRQDLSNGNAGGWTGSGAPPVYNGVPTGNGDLTNLLASAAVESIGRQIASVGSTALYAAATTGQEVALSGSAVTVASVAGLLAKIDPAYLPGAKLYVSAGDYAKLAADDVTKLAHFPVPVVATNAATDYAASSVSGPVLGNLGRFISMRRVNDVTVQVLRERFADNLQVGINCYFRCDFQPRGEVTAVAFSK